MAENCFSLENFHTNTVEYLELRRDTLTAKLGAIKCFFFLLRFLEKQAQKWGTDN